jgi:hypothetical protein
MTVRLRSCSEGQAITASSQCVGLAASTLPRWSRCLVGSLEVAARAHDADGPLVGAAPAGGRPHCSAEPVGRSRAERGRARSAPLTASEPARVPSAAQSGANSGRLCLGSRQHIAQALKSSIARGTFQRCRRGDRTGGRQRRARPSCRLIWRDAPPARRRAHHRGRDAGRRRRRVDFPCAADVRSGSTVRC